MGSLALKTKKKKILEQHGRCYYCGVLLSGVINEVDHILPFSKHRNGTVKNQCICCVTCNRQKGDKEVSEFKKVIAPEKLIRGLLYCEFIGLHNG